MRVICIDGVKAGEIGITAKTKQRKPASMFEQIFEGVVYTVIEETSGGYYVLEEIGPMTAYNKNKFIQISNIDETEFVREYKTQKA